MRKTNWFCTVILVFFIGFSFNGICQIDFKSLDQYITQISNLQENNEYAKIIALTTKTSKNLTNTDQKKAITIVNNVAYANMKSKQNEFITQAITERYKNALNQSRKLGNKQLEIWCSLNTAFYFYNHLQYKYAVPYFLPALSYLKENPSEQPYDSFNSYKKISYFLTFVKDYGESNYFLKRASSLAKNTPEKLAAIYYLMGNNSIQQNLFPEAKKQSLTAKKYAIKYNDQNYLSRIYGNLALVYLHEKNYKKAENLLLKDLEISQKINSHRNYLYAATKLGTLYIETKKYVQFETLLSDIENYQSIDKISYNWYKPDILTLKMQYAMNLGKNNEELSLRRKMDSLSYAQQLLQDEQAFNGYWINQKSKYQIQSEKNKHKLSQTYNRFVISMVIVIALFSIGVIVVFSFYTKNKKEKAIFRQMMVELLSKNKKIKLNNDQLHQFAKDKELELAELKNNYIKIESEYIKYTQKQHEKLNELLDSHILTEESWIEFRNAFDKKYPDYLPFLQENFTDLTDNNLKIILLLKLNLSHSEIGNMLGISPESVKKAIQRLRKKLGEHYDMLFK